MNKKIDRYDADPGANEYASPPCYMHEMDPSYFGLAPPSETAESRKPRPPGGTTKTLAKKKGANVKGSST